MRIGALHVLKVQHLGGPIGIHVEDLVELACLEEQNRISASFLDVPPLLLGRGQVGLAQYLEHFTLVDPQSTRVVVGIVHLPAIGILPMRRVEELKMIVPMRTGRVDLLVHGEGRLDEFFGIGALRTATGRHGRLRLRLLTNPLGRHRRCGLLGNGIVLLTGREGGKVGKYVRLRRRGTTGIGRGDERWSGRCRTVGTSLCCRTSTTTIGWGQSLISSTTPAALIDGDLDRLLLLAPPPVGFSFFFLRLAVPYPAFSSSSSDFR